LEKSFWSINAPAVCELFSSPLRVRRLAEFKIRCRYVLTVNHILQIAFSVISLALFCFTITACDYKPSHAREIAWKATERFHQEFNDPTLRDFHVVHGISGHPEVIPHPLPPDVREAKATLGSFKSATVKSCKTASQPSGVVVHFLLDSKFERGSATESISFLVTGTSAVPWGYSIESPLLKSQ
jgi:hypothetical protein